MRGGGDDVRIRDYTYVMRHRGMNIVERANCAFGARARAGVDRRRIIRCGAPSTVPNSYSAVSNSPHWQRVKNPHSSAVLQTVVVLAGPAPCDFSSRALNGSGDQELNIARRDHRRVHESTRRGAASFSAVIGSRQS